MFLGWAFNALSMGFVVCFVQERSQAWYKWPFYLINLTVLGMLIAFPIQGYAFYSIAVSTLHTVFVVVLAFGFLKTPGRTGKTMPSGLPGLLYCFSWFPQLALL